MRNKPLRIIVTPRVELDQRQILHLSKRVAASDHANDNGPLKAWGQAAAEPMLYAISLATTIPMPIGILYANFLEQFLEVGWWIDVEWRLKGFGKPAVAEFAALLKLKHPNYLGPLHAPVMTFGGRHDDASRALLEEFKHHFYGG